MKNFRKVLALVLVVATLFSFAAMASAKTLADYKDADKITTENYEVAVEVLTALEILDGYEDDTFKPTNTITRAEMAKMIAVLANAGDANVDKLYAAACNFADVDKVNDWFASYVSYCAYTGIVSGRSADTFDPYGKVTGIETAKMLLVTIGFDADVQGYKGANWKINVLRDAENFGLLEGFAAGYEIDEAITREEAAQMMLNALKSQVVVGVLSENIVKITNALYTSLPIVTLPDAEHAGFKLLYKNVIVIPYLTLGEALYESRLDMDVDAIDCYDRPGTVWTLTNKKGTTILEGKFFADPVFATSTKAVDFEDVLEEELDLGYDAEIYVDGILWGYEGNLAAASEITGKGVLTEIYVDDAADLITVVIINTYIGKVDATVKGSNTFTIDAVEEEYKIANDTTGSLCFSNKGYDFAEGDVILFWICDDDFDNKGIELHNAKKATATVATATRGETVKGAMDESKFVADGKTYEYAFNYANCMNDASDVIGVPTMKEDIEIYVDEYGYVMWWDYYTEATETFYAYVVEDSVDIHYHVLNVASTKKYEAVKTFVDFEAKITEGTSVTENMFKALVGGDAANRGALVEYAVDADGRAYVVTPATMTSGTNLTKKGDLVNAADDSVIAYGNADTKYLVRTWDYEAEEYVYTAYTEDTLPSGFAGYVWFNNQKVRTIQYFTEKVATDKTTDVLTYVFIDAIYAITAQRAFVLEYSKSVTDAKFVDQFKAYDAYKAVVNGEISFVLLNDTQALQLVEDKGTLINCGLVAVGITDEGYPIYVLDETVAPDLTTERIEWAGEELVYADPEKGGVSKDVTADFFGVVVDPDGEVTILEDAADLNAFIETLKGLEHAPECTGDNCECQAYGFENSWIVEDDGDIAELYINLRWIEAAATVA